MIYLVEFPKCVIHVQAENPDQARDKAMTSAAQILATQPGEIISVKEEQCK